jgi:hypothetical protein
VYRTTASTLLASTCGDDVDQDGFPLLSDPDCWPSSVAAAQTVGGHPTGHFLDKEWLAVGDTGDGEHVWVTYTNFALDDNAAAGFDGAGIEAVRCDADLTGCTQPTVVSGSDQDVQFSDVTVGPDGRTYVSWAGIQGELTQEAQTFSPKLAIAESGGTSFGPGELLTNETNAIPFGGFLQADDFRIATYPKSAVAMVGDTPRVFMTWEACKSRVLDFSCQKPVIKVAYSDTDGVSWVTKRVSGGGGSYFPWVAVDPDTGKVVVSYYTDRLDPWHHRYDVILATLNPVAKVLHRQLVTSVSNEPDADPLLGGFFIGDYFQVVAAGGRAYVHYNANYASMQLLGEGFPGYQQDNYLARVAE